MNQIITKLKEFIDSKHRNLWIQDDFMSVYVRKGNHFIEKTILSTLDIASVEVEESKRNQGIWTNFLNQAHEINPYQATYIECVHNIILSDSLVKHGWQTVGESFYIRKDKV